MRRFCVNFCKRRGTGAFIRSLHRRSRERGRDSQSKCLRGLEVHSRFVFGRRLHRQIDRLCASQDAIDIGCRFLQHVDIVDPVGHEGAGCDEVAPRIDRRQAVACRKRNEEIAMGDDRGIWYHEEAAVGHSRNDSIDCSTPAASLLI